MADGFTADVCLARRVFAELVSPQNSLSLSLSGFLKLMKQTAGPPEPLDSCLRMHLLLVSLTAAAAAAAAAATASVEKHGS